MNKVYFFLTITLLSCTTSVAQYKYLKQAKEAINERKFESAIEKIETYQKKEGVNTGYFYLKFLLHNALGEALNDIDSANYYLNISLNEISKFQVKEKDNICKELNFCETNNSVLISETEEKTFKAYCNSKKEENVNQFLVKYPNNVNIKLAENLRDSLELERIISNGQSREIELFLTRRPNSIFINSAKLKLQQIEFSNAKQENTIESFETFIKKYPDAKEINEAVRISQELSYLNAINENSEIGYKKFLAKYSNSPKKDDIENRMIELIWNRIKNNDNKNELNEFINDYPKSIFTVQAKEKIEMIDWTVAKRDNSIDSYSTFITNYPNSQNINEAKTKIQSIKSAVLPYLTTEKKYKLYNLTNQSFVSDIAYDEMYLQKNGLIIISNYKKYGVIDCSGNVIIPATYDCITSAFNSFIVSLGDKYGVIDLKGTKVIPITFDYITLSNDSLFNVQIKKNDTTYDNNGVYDLSGNKIFDCNYTSIQKVNNNLFILNSPNGYSIATKQGAISKKYPSLSHLKDDLFVFESLKKEGIINAEGKVIIPATYKYIQKLDENYLTITNATDRKGLVDYNGNVILTPSYYDIQKISSELLLLDLKKKYDEPIVSFKLYNIKKKEFLNNIEFDQILEIQEGLIVFSKNEKLGYIDTLGNIKIQPIFSSDILIGPGLGGYGEGDGAEGDGTKCYGANENLNNIDFYYFNEYMLSPNFSYGLATVQIGNQYGYINKSGDITIPIIYDMAYAFHEKISIVAFKTKEDNYTYNIIDQSGRNLVENINPVAYYDRKHFLLYKSAGRYYKINTLNHNIESLNISDEYNNLCYFDKNYYSSYYKGCELYITDNGEPLMARNIDFSAYEMEQTIQKGIELFYNQKYDDCIGVFESVTAKQNNNFEANLWLAKTYVAQKKYYNANNQFEKCIAIDPNNISPIIERKEMNYEQKSWRAYTSDMEKLKPKSEYVFSADDYFKCGYAYSQIYEKDEALNHYNMAIGLDPQMGSAYNNRGVIYLDKGNKSQALLDYGMAIKNTSKTDKESLGLYYSNRGNLYYNMKRKAEACADFKKGAAVDNQNCKNMLRYCK